MDFKLNGIFFTGIHLHILVTATLYGIGRVGTNIRKDAMAEKEAILKHYISLHPDDFPPYGSKLVL